MKIINKFKDPLTRQANEAVRIGRRNEKKGELLNSKNEFHHPKIARIIVEKNNGYKVNQHGKSFLNLFEKIFKLQNTFFTVQNN